MTVEICLSEGPICGTSTYVTRARDDARSSCACAFVYTWVRQVVAVENVYQVYMSVCWRLRLCKFGLVLQIVLRTDQRCSIVVMHSVSGCVSNVWRAGNVYRDTWNVFWGVFSLFSTHTIRNRRYLLRNWSVLEDKLNHSSQSVDRSDHDVDTGSITVGPRQFGGVEVAEISVRATVSLVDHRASSLVLEGLGDFTKSGRIWQNLRLVSHALNFTWTDPLCLAPFVLGLVARSCLP